MSPVENSPDAESPAAAVAVEAVGAGAGVEVWARTGVGVGAAAARGAGAVGGAVTMIGRFGAAADEPAAAGAGVLPEADGGRAAPALPGPGTRNGEDAERTGIGSNGCEG
ncbi:MAG: hypothetical protein ACKVZJ_06020 [Phycisphaerales bacterium]